MFSDAINLMMNAWMSKDKATMAAITCIIQLVTLQNIMISFTYDQVPF